MTNPKIFAVSKPLPPLWLQERGTYNPATRTLTFTRTYTPAAATDIRETFARAQLQLHIDRHEKDQLVIDFSNNL